MDKLKDNFNGVFEKLKSIDKKIWIIIGSVVAAVIVVWIALSTIKSKDYRVLYSGLTTEESNEILGKLQELNSDYKYDGNGKISVPSGKEDKLRATLAAQGYPKSGFNYDVFKNNVGMMTTDMEKKNYLVFDLQNKLQGCGGRNLSVGRVVLFGWSLRRPAWMSGRGARSLDTTTLRPACTWMRRGSCLFRGG